MHYVSVIVLLALNILKRLVRFKTLIAHLKSHEILVLIVIMVSVDHVSLELEIM